MTIIYLLMIILLISCKKDDITNNNNIEHVKVGTVVLSYDGYSNLGTKVKETFEYNHVNPVGHNAGILPYINNVVQIDPWMFDTIRFQSIQFKVVSLESYQYFIRLSATIPDNAVEIPSYILSFRVNGTTASGQNYVAQYPAFLPYESIEPLLFQVDEQNHRLIGVFDHTYQTLNDQGQEFTHKFVLEFDVDLYQII